jgi:GAF domain-containing protein
VREEVLAEAVLCRDAERELAFADQPQSGLVGLEQRAGQVDNLGQHGLSEDFLAHVAALRGNEETIGLRAINERRPQWMRKADTDQGIGLLRETYAAEGIRTVCLVPLVGGDQRLGLLGLYHRRDRTWPAEEIALVQAFADQAAVAIQNARLYRSVAAQAARMRSIQDLSSRLNRLTDVRAIAEAIVAEARTLAEYHDIRVYRVDAERRMCEPIAFTREMLDDDAQNPEDLLRVEVGHGFTGWVAEHGEPLLINDALDDERGQTIEGTDDVPESMLVLPMLYEGKTLGVIVLSQLGYNRFTNDDLQTMSIFAGYAARARSTGPPAARRSSRSRWPARRSRRRCSSSGDRRW